jgi:phage terminase small subunit
MSLTELQERFCQEYLVDCNASAAAVRAGYSGAKQGYTLMEIPDIRERIRVLQDERAVRLQVKADWVIQNLREIVNRCMELEPVTEKGQLVLDTDTFGEVRAVVKFDARGATTALQLLGKHIGMFVDKVEHSGSVEHKEMPENEIARRVAYILHNAVRDRQTVQ